MESTAGQDGLNRNPAAGPGAEEAGGCADAGPAWTADLRHLLGLAAAGVAGTLAQTVMSFVDYWIVSQLPDASAAQAAVSSAGLVYFAIFGFLLGAMLCTTTVVSQSLGAGRRRDCSVYGWQGFWISMLYGLLAMLLWPLMPAIYGFFGHDPAVQEMEVVYTRVRLLSLGAAGAGTALGHYFIGIHRPWPNANSSIGSNLLNAVLTYGLVLGCWGLPAMGVEGAAWGTTIATFFRLAWLMWAMCLGPEAGLFEARYTWGWDADKARRLLRVGWPAGVSLVADIGAWAVFLVAIIGMFGTVHLAATGTVWRFTELSFMPAIGIGHAVSTMVGRSIGEGRPDLARRRAGLGAVLNVLYMGLMGVVFVAFGEPLMRLFCQDPEVIDLGVRLLVFAAVFQVFDAVAITYNHALRGAGDTTWPAVVGALQAWTIMIACGLLIGRLRPDLGSLGPWTFATLFVIVVGLTFWVRWRRGAWRNIDVIGLQPESIEVAAEARLPGPAAGA